MEEWDIQNTLQEHCAKRRTEPNQHVCATSNLSVWVTYRTG